MVTVFFYSHSHGPDGLSCAEGQSVLVSFPCLDDLVSFMYAVYDSMLVDVSEQFDMLPIELKLRSENLTSENSSRCFMTNDVCETINEEITQSYKSKPVSSNMQKEITSGKTMESKTKINLMKSRKENPQKLTQLSSRHLVGKRPAQKDTIIDITSDSQVDSNFPNRWSPACLTFNNYFYQFYIYI